MEKVALEAAHESMAAHTADLEEKLKALEATTARTAKLERQLEEATAQVAHLEAERNDVLEWRRCSARRSAAGTTTTPTIPRTCCSSPAARATGWSSRTGRPRPPARRSSFPEDDGTSSTLLVTKVGASPLPGPRLACAYLVTAA